MFLGENTVVTQHQSHASCNDVIDLTTYLPDFRFRETAQSGFAETKGRTFYSAHNLPRILGRFVTAGDTATLEHSIRVSLLADVGAESLGYTARERHAMAISGLAHDLGKLHPEIAAVVHNGRVLTTKERELVNQHAQLGFNFLYNSSPSKAVSVRERLGGFMAEISLNTLFSHANAARPSQRGTDARQLELLVEQGIISENDVAQHGAKPHVQLLSICDVTDALLSSGSERAYRSSRMKLEGMSIEINPTSLPELINQTVHAPAINVELATSAMVSKFNSISHMARKIVSEISKTHNVDKVIHLP